MQANSNNIDNPLKRIDIDLDAIVNDPPRNATIIHITQDQYDRMQYHDPTVIYVITNTNDHRYYFGDHLIIEEKWAAKYYLALGDNDNEFVIYMGWSDYSDRYHILTACRYTNLTDAIDALYRYKRAGSHYDQDLNIYEALSSYIFKENGINETIISIIANSGYTDDPRLQNLIERGITYGVRATDRDLPAMYKNDLRKGPFPGGSLIPIYADIYDIFVLFKFFKDININKVDPKDLDLANAISCIHRVVRKRLTGSY